MERKNNEIVVETLFLGNQGSITDLDSIAELNKKIEFLNTGDIVIITPVEASLQHQQKHFNEAKFYFVCHQSGSNPGKYLSEMTKSPNGWSTIPVTISKQLENSFNGDFIQDYMKKFLKLFNGYANRFKGIELDLESKRIPENFLAKNNIQNNNNNDLRVFYFFEQPTGDENKDFDGDFYVWINKAKPGVPKHNDAFFSLTNDLENLDIEMEDSFSVFNASMNESELEKSTDPSPPKTLSFDIVTDRDFEMEEYAKNFKTIYENQFKDSLSKLNKNDLLSVTSLPTKPYCKETFENDLMNSITLSFFFDSLELDDNGKLSAVITCSHDRLHTYYFEPYLCDKYGPFYSTTLFTCMYNVGRTNSVEQMFFLDLPLDLYNLLETDE